MTYSHSLRMCLVKRSALKLNNFDALAFEGLIHCFWMNLCNSSNHFFLIQSFLIFKIIFEHLN